MSTAKAMPTYRRLQAYIEQNGRNHLTPRQVRQINRMATREAVRATRVSSAGPPPG